MEKENKQALLEAALEPTIKDERSKEDGHSLPRSLPSSPFFLSPSFLHIISVKGYKRLYTDNQVFLLFDDKVPFPRDNGYLFPLEPSRDSLCMQTIFAFLQMIVSYTCCPFFAFFFFFHLKQLGDYSGHHDYLPPLESPLSVCRNPYVSIPVQKSELKFSTSPAAGAQAYSLDSVTQIQSDFNWEVSEMWKQDAFGVSIKSSQPRIIDRFKNQ